MSAAVFTPDPLLSRATPLPREGFDVLGLLAPARPTFARDPLLSPLLAHEVDTGVPDAAKAFLAGADHEAGSAGEAVVPGLPLAQAGVAEDGASLSPDVGPHTAYEELDLSRIQTPEELREWLDRRYREGFEDGLAQGARLGGEDSEDVLTDEMSAADGEGGGRSALPVSGSGAVGRDALLLLESLSRALAPLLLPDDAATRFEPLKRLALHLAMELVRQELSVSPRAVEHLVRRSVQALQAAETAPVVVELNPQDLELMKAVIADPDSGLGADPPILNRVKWLEDAQLERGSVRARSDISSVEDLIGQRLASIIQDLRIQGLQWQADEANLQSQLSDRAPEAPDGAARD
jgi:flagellar biosynthesis/type III secretory pathway protein FliH